MSTQQGPPSRPWFRLATMIRPPPPAAPTSQGPQPPPPRPAFIRPAFAPMATRSTPNPSPLEPTSIPPLPQPNPIPSPPFPTTNAVAPPEPPTATALSVTQALASSSAPPSSPSLKRTQSSAPNTPPSTPLETLNSPPSALQSQSLKPSQVTNTNPITTTPPKSVKPLEKIASPLPSVNVVTPPIETPKFQSAPWSPPTSTTLPPSQQSTTPMRILRSPPPAPQLQSPEPSTTMNPITTTLTLTPPKVVKPLEQVPPPLPAVNVVTPPVSPRSQKFPLPAPPPSSPNNTTLIHSPSSSPPRPPPVPQSEHSLPVSNSPQSRSMSPFSPPHIIKLPEKTLATALNPLSPKVLPSLNQNSYNETPPEYKQKTMHVLETKEKPKDLADVMHTTGNTHSFRHDIPRKPETHKKHWDSQVVGKSVITIAGDNKRAIMSLTSEAKNTHQISNPQLMTTVLNSNVQGVNSSILYNCYINHHDAGIHLTLSRKSNGDCELHPKDHKKE